MHLAFALSHLCSVRPFIYHLLAVGSISLNLAAFAFVIARGLRSKAAGILGLSLGLTWLQNSWNHNLFTSFPVVLHLGLTLLLCVVALLLTWQTKGGGPFAVFAGIGYFMALLVSESFVAYLPILIGVCVSKAWQVPGCERRKRVRIVARGSLPILAALALYLICYFGYRYAFPSQHSGNQLAPFDIGRIASVVWQYSVSTFPGYFYFRDPMSMNATFDGFTPNSGSVWQLIERGRPEWIAKALVASLFCGLLLARRSPFFTARAFLLSILAGLMGLVAPVCLISLTLQYQEWVLVSNSLAYGAPSYYAYFAMVWLILTIMLWANQLLARNLKVWRIYVVVACCFVAGTSWATDYYNYYITLDQQLSHLKWRTVDRFIQTDEFAAVRDSSVIYAPTLWRSRGLATNGDNYWTEYFNQRSGKKVVLCRSAAQFQDALKASPGLPGYFLAFEQEPKEQNQFVVFATLERPRDVSYTGAVSAKSFGVFMFSRNRKFTLVGQSADGLPVAVEVNGERVGDATGPFFVAPIDHEQTAGDFPKTTVRASAPVDLTQLVISFFPIEQRKVAVEVQYGRGFYPHESDASGNSWNWSAEQAELMVINNSAEEAERSIQFTLTAFTARAITLNAGGIERTIALTAGGSQAVELSRVVLQPGENKFSFRSDQPAQLIGNGDPRRIAFGLRNLVISDPRR